MLTISTESGWHGGEYYCVNRNHLLYLKTNGLEKVRKSRRSPKQAENRWLGYQELHKAQKESLRSPYSMTIVVIYSSQNFIDLHTQTIICLFLRMGIA